jgi:hypothetical protein
VRVASTSLANRRKDPVTPAYSLLAVLLCAATINDGARIPGPTLTISYAPYQVIFNVSGPEEPFLGAILGSLEPEMTQFFEGVPPLLSNFVVLDVGFGDGIVGYTAVFPELMLPPGVLIYVQGITIDSAGLDATAVDTFVLDVTVPPR